MIRAHSEVDGRIEAGPGERMNSPLVNREIRLRVVGDALEIDTPAGPLRATRAP